MVSEPFRLAVVGAGRMGATHLRALAHSSATPVVAIVEPIAPRRAELAGAYEVSGYASVSELLDSGSCDGVVVVTPSTTHVAVIEEVASAGLPILCEKPCGTSPEDTRQAAEIVSRASVPLQVAYWRRFVPELATLRQRMDDGELGTVLTIICAQWDGSPPAAGFRAGSGGIFVDMGVHEFDQARWLTHGDLQRVEAVSSTVMTDPAAEGDPDAAQAIALSTSGATVVVSLGRYFPGGDMAEVEVYGTGGHEIVRFLDPAGGDSAQLRALERQASAFSRFARGGACEGATVDDAVKALEAAAAT